MGDVPTAVFVGRLNDWKGWEVFAEAARRVHKRIPESRFCTRRRDILERRDYDRDRRLDARGDRHRLGERLHWSGEVDDARSVMQQGWVVVVPSTRPEPFGNAVIEGMAEARPIVGSNLGGIPEIMVEGETGLLVRPGAADELADALVMVLADRRLAEQMGAAALRRYTDAFTPAVHERVCMLALTDAIGEQTRPT